MVFSAVSWRKDGIPFRNSTTRPIKAEGERHTLLVRSARMTDAGLYTVCASNEVAETCCSAILTVRPGKGKGEGEMPEQPVCHGGYSQAGALRPEELRGSYSHMSM